LEIKSKLPSLLTILNALLGLLVIINSIEEEYTTAAVLLIIAVLIDFLDGKVARKLKKSTAFGRELDSLADIISFGISPAVFAYSIGFIEFTSIFILMLFLACGMIRLARFNITDESHFIGMPITMNGLIIPIFYFIAPGYILYIMLISGLLMISSIRFPKLFRK